MKRLKISLRYALKNSGINCYKLINYSIGLHLYYKFVLLCRQRMCFDNNVEVDHIPFDMMFREIHFNGTTRRYRINSLKRFFTIVYNDIVKESEDKSYVIHSKADITNYQG